jgi:hypothetical protein
LLAIAAIIISSIAVDFHIKLNIFNFGTDAYAAAAVNIRITLTKKHIILNIF